MNKFTRRIVLLLRAFDHVFDQFTIAESSRSAQRVGNEGFGKSRRERFFMLGDQVAKLEVVGEFRAIVKRGRCINLPCLAFPAIFVMIFCPPPSSSIEVLQPEPDRIDLSVTTRTLRLFLMQAEAFPRRQQLVAQAVNLRDVCWSGRRRR